MKLPVIIDIEPASDTECGTCRGGCIAMDWCNVFGHIEQRPRERVRDADGRTLSWIRLQACIEAESRAFNAGLLGEEASRALTELVENPPPIPDWVKKAVQAERSSKLEEALDRLVKKHSSSDPEFPQMRPVTFTVEEIRKIMEDDS